MKKIFDYIHKNTRLLAAAAIIGFASMVAAGMMSAEPNYLMANEVIRLHILAQSDCDEDQALKLVVRDKVLELLSPILAQAESTAQTREIILANLLAIEQAAQTVLIQQNSPHTATARLSPALPFPAMSYGGLILPRGSYETLQIIIGDGDGGNWWCVVFPDLCLIDITIYDDFCYEGDDIEIIPRFKIAELWGRITNRFS